MYFPGISFLLSAVGILALISVLVGVLSLVAVGLRYPCFNLARFVVFSFLSVVGFPEHLYPSFWVIFDCMGAVVTASFALVWAKLVVRTCSDLIDWWTTGGRSIYLAFTDVLEERLQFSISREMSAEDLNERPVKIKAVFDTCIGADCAKIVCEFAGFVK